MQPGTSQEVCTPETAQKSHERYRVALDNLRQLATLPEGRSFVKKRLKGLLDLGYLLFCVRSPGGSIMGISISILVR